MGSGHVQGRAGGVLPAGRQRQRGAKRRIWRAHWLRPEPIRRGQLLPWTSWVQPDLAELLACIAELRKRTVAVHRRCIAVRRVSVRNIAVHRWRDVPDVLADFACVEPDIAVVLADEPAVFADVAIVLANVAEVQPAVAVVQPVVAEILAYESVVQSGFASL